MADQLLNGFGCRAPHGEVPGLTQVIVIVGEKDDEPGEPKLLEIKAATVATGSVEPFAFAPTSSVPFPTLLAEVTPEEFAQIESQTLPLPAGWSLARANTSSNKRALSGESSSC